MILFPTKVRSPNPNVPVEEFGIKEHNDISGWDGIYQTYDPDTYSKGAMFTFCYVGNIKYTSLLEEQ